MKWKLVPVEPTEEMVISMQAGGGKPDASHEYYGVWSDMLTASPPASEDGDLLNRLAFTICEFDDEPGLCHCGGKCTNDHAIAMARAVLKMLERSQ